MIRKENKRVCVAYGKLQQDSFSLSPTRGISKVNPQNQRTQCTLKTLAPAQSMVTGLVLRFI